MTRAQFKTHYNKGVKLAQKRKFSDAINEFEAALAIKPASVDAIFQVGNMSKAMQLYDIALKWYDVALRMKPSSIEIAFNRALALQLLGKNEDALNAYIILETAMAKDPMFWNNLGILHQQMSETLKAIDALEKAVTLKPNYFEAWNNLGLSYFINQRDTWQSAFEKAEKQYKGDAKFHLNRATCHFWSGNYQQGWKDYQYRHHPTLTQSVIYEHDIPRWKGEDLTGKTILIGEEQGIGDQITFISALADINARAAKVILEINPKLVPLITRNFPDIYVTAPQADTVDLKRHHYYDWLTEPVDYFASLGDAFYLVRPSLDDYPMRRSFLHADPELSSKWKKRLEALNKRPKVGVSWRGAKVTGERQVAYMQLAELMPLFKKMDNFQFVNIQYGNCDEELEVLEGDVDRLVTFEDLDLFDDIEGTIALIDNLDFVISVRNTQACFAAALGKKVISYHGSHFQFGSKYADPIYNSIFTVYPNPTEAPILDQFHAALVDFESTFADYVRSSGEFDKLKKNKHFYLQTE